MKAIKAKYDAFFPGNLFDYFFLTTGLMRNMPTTSCLEKCLVFFQPLPFLLRVWACLGYHYLPLRNAQKKLVCAKYWVHQYQTL